MRRFGFRISDFRLRGERETTPGPLVERGHPYHVSLRLVWACAVLCLVHVWPATAMGDGFVASVDTGQSVGRQGVYMPASLLITNDTNRWFSRTRISCGGPVDVVSSFFMGAGHTERLVFPLFYVGGPLPVTVQCEEGDSRTFERAMTQEIPVRPAPAKGAVVGRMAAWGVTDLESRLRDTLGGREICRAVSPLLPGGLKMAGRCSLLDAVVTDGKSAPPGRARVIRYRPSGDLQVVSASFPPGVLTPVQPETCRLFAEASESKAEPATLWLGLALFSLVVLMVVVLLPRRRALLAGAMALLAAAASVLIVLLGGSAGPSVREARLYYAERGKPLAALEHFVYLASHDGAAARFPLPKPQETPFPLPVLASSDDLYKVQGILCLGEAPAFESHAARLLLHVLDTQPVPFESETAEPNPAGLRAWSKRPDVVEALLVEAGGATEPEGRTQPLDAWAVEWKTSEDPDLAWCGRSLAWWDDHRRTGDGPFLVAWFRDPAPEPPEGVDAYERLPAMVVYGE